MKWIDKLVDRALEAAIERRIGERINVDSLPESPPSTQYDGIGEVNPNCKFHVDVSRLNACPEFAGRLAHLLIHDPVGLSWDEMFPEDSGTLRKMLFDGTMPDAYLERINERFQDISRGVCGKPTTVDDLKCAMMKVATTTEVS